MARISISLPDKLLRKVDREANVEDTSRSGLLQKAVIQYCEAKREAREDEERRREMQEASRKMDELAKRLGHWDPAAIIRRFRDANLKG